LSTRRQSALVDQLVELGLTASEAKAYLAVVNLGTCRVIQIADESNLQRTEIYRLMSRLVSMGLVEETIDPPKRYRPANVKETIPRLAANMRDRLKTLTAESDQLAAKLETLAAKAKPTTEEAIRVVYGPDAARAHLLESIKSAQSEFWAMVGRRRPPHISNRFLAEALRMIASKGLKAKLIVEVDRENLNLVKRLASVFEVRHHEPLPVYMYGADDRSVAVSLAEEPIVHASRTGELLITHGPSVRMLQQSFNILWQASTSFTLREDLLLGRRPSNGVSRVIRGREELYALVRNYTNAAEKRICEYVPTRYSPVRILEGFKEAFLRARQRGVSIRIVCGLTKDNAEAVKSLGELFEVRHTDSPIGFSFSVVDQSDAIVHHVDPDSPELESRADYSIHITNKQGVRHLATMFEMLWKEATPIERSEATRRQ
jgi:sugar-specific transcriptional regulator TrmB